MPRLTGAIAVLAATMAFMAPAAEGAVSGPGKVNFVRNATSSFDPYLTGASAGQREWIADTYWRIRGYDPFFANVGAVSWTGPSHYYEDLYAIYRDFPEHQALINQHPDWVLRDGAGRPLFIPADCNGQTCTQYAADIGNPGYRAWWISQARSTLAKGYEGIFIDDVNMDMKVANGAAQDVIPGPAPRCRSRAGGATWPSSRSRSRPPSRTTRSSTTRTGGSSTTTPTCSARSTPPTSSSSSAATTTADWSAAAASGDLRPS
jgi:hypothetical protein